VNGLYNDGLTRMERGDLAGAIRIWQELYDISNLNHQAAGAAQAAQVLSAAYLEAGKSSERRGDFLRARDYAEAALSQPSTQSKPYVMALIQQTRDSANVALTEQAIAQHMEGALKLPNTCSSSVL
jgi:tetratricopeptide (TPR) repeat protein